jgi:hypothetical protein
MGRMSDREFGIRVDQVEVTWGGFWGPPADTHRKFVPGLKHFTIDGEDVSEDEFRRRYTAAAEANGLPPLPEPTE